MRRGSGGVGGMGVGVGVGVGVGAGVGVADRAAQCWETGSDGGPGFSGTWTGRREYHYSSELCYSLGTGLLAEELKPSCFTDL